MKEYNYEEMTKLQDEFILANREKNSIGKRHLSENNFIVRDSNPANHCVLAILNEPWLGGQACYGARDGSFYSGGLNSPPDLQEATSVEAREFSKKLRAKEIREEIIFHLDEIAKLRESLNLLYIDNP